MSGTVGVCRVAVLSSWQVLGACAWLSALTAFVSHADGAAQKSGVDSKVMILPVTGWMNVIDDA